MRVDIIETARAIDPRSDLGNGHVASAPDAEDPSEAGRLPLAPLAGLAASGTFAVWTSLTCFVC